MEEDGVGPYTEHLLSVEKTGAWDVLLSRQKLAADKQHFYRVEGGARVTHVRVTMFPDGGISRIRMVGTPDLSSRIGRTWKTGGRAL